MGGPAAQNSPLPSSRPPTRAQREPVRTCVGCRERGARSELVRLVALDPATVVVDERRSAPGRGGWLHPRHSCLELALRRRAVGRALRLQQPPDTTAVASWLAQHSAPAAGDGQESSSGLGVRTAQERATRAG